MTSGLTPVARGGSGAKAPPLAARPKRRVLEKISEKLVSVGQNQLKSLKVWSCFQLTREITLNDTYFSQYFPKRKVL